MLYQFLKTTTTKTKTKNKKQKTKNKKQKTKYKKQNKTKNVCCIFFSYVTIDNGQKAMILPAAVQFELCMSNLMSFITSLLLLYIL